MKQQEQLIREILDGQRYAVRPEHEAAFREMLTQRKDKRRILAFIFLLVAGTGIAGYALLPDGFMQQKTEEISGKSIETSSASSRALIGHEQALRAQGAVSAASGAADENAHSSAGHEQGLNQAGTSEYNTAAPSSAKHVSGKTRQSATESGNTSGESKTRGSVPGEVQNKNANPVSGTSTPEAEEVPVFIDQEVSESVTDNVAHNAGTHESTPASAEHTLTDATAISDAVSEKQEEVPIIPAKQLSKTARLSAGLAAGYALVNLAKKNGSDIGHLFSAGVFAKYRLSERLAARSTLGLSYQNGGFTFNKSSENEVFGFGLDKERYDLRMHKLYAATLSAELGWKVGSIELYGGALGEYVYGAKGDIMSEEIVLDVPYPRITNSEDVWVSVSDMRKFTVHALAGVRTQIMPRLELSAGVRIPVISPDKPASAARNYTYEISTTGIAPVFGLTYELYQQ